MQGIIPTDGRATPHGSRGFKFKPDRELGDIWGARASVQVRVWTGLGPGWTACRRCRTSTGLPFSGEKPLLLFQDVITSTRSTVFALTERER